MSGTVKGGLKAARTTKQRYGEDYYMVVGREGGLRHHKNKGFGHPSIDASAAGRKGGAASRRTKRPSINGI